MEKKIIDLEIIDELEDSGVDAIALVDNPAIEKNFMYFKKEVFVEPNAGESESDYMGRCVPVLIDEGKEQDQAVAICISTYENMGKQVFAEDSFTDYPEAAKENAKRALAYAEENGWGDCGTPIGKARANQLAAGEAISIETVARMASFERHRQNSKTPSGEGCGKLMWDAWGGDEGIAWAQKTLESSKEEFETICPPATQDIELNLANRQECIDVAHYGPLNPNEPNDPYWAAKAEMFNTTVEEAKTALCGNCAFFKTDQATLDCIASGIGTEDGDPFDVIDAGQLGYCEAFDFKCAAARTCDAWVAISEEQFEINTGGLAPYTQQTPKKKKDLVKESVALAESPISRIPKEERGREGSDKNEAGDTKTSRGGIEVSQEVESTLKDKIKEHNEKNTQDSQKADLGMLKAVWRRGAGAYSVGTPGRKGMTRSQWAMGRVNAFLRILSGSAPSDKDYKQDNDLLPKGHPKHSEVKLSNYMFADESKKELVGPVAIPEMEIPRKDDDGNIYFVRFSKDVVKKMAEKFMREQRLADNNIQHKDEENAGSYVFESWVVENEGDKANSVYNLGVPVGTWMVKMRVTNTDTWKKVRAGELNGFSLQGNFVSQEEYDTYMSDKKTYEDLINLIKGF